MQMLLIHVKDMANPLGLRFKERSVAEAARDTIIEDMKQGLYLRMQDDFDQAVVVSGSPCVLAISIIDVEQDLEAQGQIALIQAKKNQDVQNRAQAQAGAGLMLPGQLRRPN